jgi:hypothetical protein
MTRFEREGGSSEKEWSPGPSSKLTTEVKRTGSLAPKLTDALPNRATVSVRSSV